MTLLDRAQGAVNIAFHGLGPPGPGIDTGLFLAVLDEVREYSWVELSFDDGYASDVEIALPALIARGISARFFPLAGRLGSTGHVSASGVRELAAAGMAIGSHGMKHCSWRGLGRRAMHEELVGARNRLAAAAGTPIDTAACPFGSYDRRVLAALREQGYARVFTSDRRRARTGAWLQPRYSVRRDDTIQTIRDDILAPQQFPGRIKSALSARVKAWR